MLGSSRAAGSRAWQGKPHDYRLAWTSWLHFLLGGSRLREASRERPPARLLAEPGDHTPCGMCVWGGCLAGRGLFLVLR